MKFQEKIFLPNILYFTKKQQINYTQNIITQLPIYLLQEFIFISFFITHNLLPR